MVDPSEYCQQPVQLAPIGVIRSCFPEKFGIPRQPGMVRSAIARLELYPPYGREEMVRGLDQFSHVWVHFLFHRAVEEGWRPTVRPPWLGGRQRVGVFASRSPHRPNHLGLSVVRLEKIARDGSSTCLELSGVDFLDGTPVVDLKPYLPYSDAIPSASGGYGRGQGAMVRLLFSREAEEFCLGYRQRTGRNIRRLIEEIIEHDPRPACQKASKTEFGVMLWNINVRWRVAGDGFVVESCEELRGQESR